MGKKQGLLIIQTNIVDSVLSISGIYFVSRKFQPSCFVSFLRVLLGSYHKISQFTAFPCLWNEQLFITNLDSPAHENTQSGFQATEAQSQKVAHTEHLVGEWVNHPIYSRGLDGRKASVSFHCKAPLQPVFFHWMEYTLPVGYFKPLVLCHL